jgi:hypothetical protein
MRWRSAVVLAVIAAHLSGWVNRHWQARRLDGVDSGAFEFVAAEKGDFLEAGHADRHLVTVHVRLQLRAVRRGWQCAVSGDQFGHSGLSSGWLVCMNHSIVTR